MSEMFEGNFRPTVDIGLVVKFHTHFATFQTQRDSMKLPLITQRENMVMC